GNLWISTNGGLCRISEESDEWVFQNFTVEDGLQSNEFNQYSFHQSTSGQLYFGGSVGLTQFDPIRVKPSSYHPPLTITRFLLFNKEQRAQTSSVLDHSIQWTERIPLSHHQNFLAFEFAALGFQQSQNQAYAYRLVGLEEEWIQAENRRFAAYPNLAPGNYRFEVKATNHDGIWSAETKGIDIHIKQPWWKQWWAILLWTSLLLGLIRMIILNRENTIRRIEQAKLQEREAFRKRSAQDFHDEAGNRITKLSLLTEVARRQKPAQDAILNQIQEHIQSLRSGMRDFIWVLDPEQDQLADLYQRLIRMGNQLFEHTNIQFHPRPIPEKAATWVVPGYQRRHLLMIFQEATNNVVKYAQCQNVYLGISINGNQVSIWLKDDGQGFILGETEGYGIRNMKERAQKIDGRLQIDSTLGQQTQVSLSWNIPQMGD
ncbi:MAG: triple tyrosine motif-containing protein, partial [Bacteroidota bacterium]